MPLGLLVWLVLIFLIACGVGDGFFTLVATIIGLLILGSLIYLWIEYLREESLKMKDSNPSSSQHVDREKAIDEWEKKWKRKHPTRINKKH